MKKTVAIVLSLLFLFGAASLSLAAMKQLTGNVTALDQKAMTITVHGRRGEVTASIDGKTRIVEGKEKKALADVQVGAKVTLKYTKVEGKDVAKRIVIKESAQAKEEATALPGY